MLGTHSWMELLSPSALLMPIGVAKPQTSVRGGGGWMDTADFTCSSSLSCEAFHPKGTFCLQWGPSATGPAAMSQTL